MALAISTNFAINANTALNAMNKSQSLMGKSISRISTGNRAANPADDPLSYFSGNKIKGDTDGYQALYNGIQDGAARLNVADSALSSIIDVLTEMKSKAIAYDSTSDTDAQKSIEKAYTQLYNSLSTFKGTQYKGSSVWDDSGLSFVTTLSGTGGSTSTTYTVDDTNSTAYDSAAGTKVTDGTWDGTSGTIKVGSTTYEIKKDSNDTYQAYESGQTAAQDVNVTVSGNTVTIAKGTGTGTLASAITATSGSFSVAFKAATTPTTNPTSKPTVDSLTVSSTAETTYSSNAETNLGNENSTQYKAKSVNVDANGNGTVVINNGTNDTTYYFKKDDTKLYSDEAMETEVANTTATLTLTDGSEKLTLASSAVSTALNTGSSAISYDISPLTKNTATTYSLTGTGITDGNWDNSNSTGTFKIGTTTYTLSSTADTTDPSKKQILSGTTQVGTWSGTTSLILSWDDTKFTGSSSNSSNSSNSTNTGDFTVASTAIGDPSSDYSSVTSTLSKGMGGTIQTAINNISNRRVELGGNLSALDSISSYLSSMVTANDAAYTAVTEANIAKEMTSYVKNNVYSQAAQAMISQANQSLAQVLNLLQ